MPLAKPDLCVELFAGCFGWSRGWLEAGGRAIGVDIEHLPHHGPVPLGAHLILQDVRTIHGSQFKQAAVLLCSPPCTEYSYMAMPWKRAKQISAGLRGQGVFPEGYKGSRTIAELNTLFDACFRIQREACEAAGRYIPMVVENVKGAQPWVGPAKANFGSFYLWGDVGNVGGAICGPVPVFGETVRAARRNKGFGGTWFHNAELGTTNPNRSRTAEDPRKVPGMNFHEFEKTGHPGRSFQSAAVEHTAKGFNMESIKNNGGSWFAVAHNTESGHGQNPVSGQKVATYSDPRRNGGKGARLKNPEENLKRLGGGTKQGGDWFGPGEDCSIPRRYSSKSSARKAASAQIAKIPAPLARYVARIFKPSASVVGLNRMQATDTAQHIHYLDLMTKR